MKTLVVFLGLLACVFAAPEPQFSDAEFVDVSFPRGGDGSRDEVPQQDEDPWFFGFSFPSHNLPCISFLRPCDDNGDTDLSTPFFDVDPFREIFTILDRSVPEVKYDFENTTQEERVVGDTLLICNKTIKAANSGGFQSMVVSETCVAANRTDTASPPDGPVSVTPKPREPVTPEDEIPNEVTLEVEAPKPETNEIPRVFPESTDDGPRRRERRGLWWWPFINKDYNTHPAHTLINLITDDDSSKKDWSLKVTTVNPQAELVGDLNRPFDLSGDTRVNYANRDYTRESMAEVDPDAEVFDWDLVMKEARENSHQEAPQNGQAPSQAFESIPVQSKPLRSFPMRSEPLRSLPMSSEPLRSLPMKPEPLRSLPMRTEPLRSLPMRSEPIRALPMRPEPVRPRPRTYEPIVATEQISSYPARSKPLHSTPVKSRLHTGEPKPFRYNHRARHLR